MRIINDQPPIINYNYQLSIKDMITDDNKKLAQWAMEIMP